MRSTTLDKSPVFIWTIIAPMKIHVNLLDKTDPLIVLMPILVST